MIGPHTRVQLAPKVRLRHDPLSGKTMLLYPERGLALSETAAAIAALCAHRAGRAETRAPTVAAMVDTLCARFVAEPRDRIADEVMTFLRALEQRGLLIIHGDGHDGEGEA